MNIVLFAPEIPQNTGNIGRLCVNAGARLHLIRPLGFSLDAAHIRRAGLDYWSHLDFMVYESWVAFLNICNPARMFFISTHGNYSVFDVSYKHSDWLVFGNEGHGLPESFYGQYADKLYRIPMPGKNARSLNLANSVAIVLYEAMRQINEW